MNADLITLSLRGFCVATVRSVLPASVSVAAPGAKTLLCERPSELDLDFCVTVPDENTRSRWRVFLFRCLLLSSVVSFVFRVV
jgi:hypothetical protein